MYAHRGVRALLLLSYACLTPVTWPQNAPDTAAPALDTAQIVARMQIHNRVQDERLLHYTSTRHYSIEYKGFASKVAGRMEVEATYDRASGKSFRILSQSGSKILCDKVLKRALDSEKEASQNKELTSLTGPNYKLQLVGTETLDGRPSYVLDVQPQTESKFLYRGKVWVDAADFAVAKIDAEPAKNPSFWIAKTRIVHRNEAVVDGFWLPKENRSESKIRVGGAAVLTIDYGSYSVRAEPADQAQSH